MRTLPIGFANLTSAAPARPAAAAEPQDAAPSLETLREMAKTRPAARLALAAWEAAATEPKAQARLLKTVFESAMPWDGNPAKVAGFLLQRLGEPFTEMVPNDGGPGCHPHVTHVPFTPERLAIGKLMLDHVEPRLADLGRGLLADLEAEAKGSIPLEGRLATTQAAVLTTLLAVGRCGSATDLASLGGALDRNLKSDLGQHCSRRLVERLRAFPEGRPVAEAVDRLEVLAPKNPEMVRMAAFDGPLTTDERLLCGRACQRLLDHDDAAALAGHGLKKALESPESRPFAEFVQESAAGMEPYPRTRFYRNALRYLGLPSEEAVRRLAQDHEHLLGCDEARDVSAPFLLGRLPRPEFTRDLFSRLETDDAKAEVVARAANGSAATPLDMVESVHRKIARERRYEPQVRHDLDVTASVATRELGMEGMRAAALPEVGTYASRALGFAKDAAEPELAGAAEALLTRWDELSTGTLSAAVETVERALQSAEGPERRTAAEEALRRLAQLGEHATAVTALAADPQGGEIRATSTTVQIGGISLDVRGGLTASAS